MVVVDELHGGILRSSIMNKRHDALYSRARVLLNQNVKRLWFKVNPYLEKDTKDAEPESPTKFIQPLQSTIVTESVWKDESTDHRNLSIGAFWEFLYSDKWPGGTSIRVMEGQLLDNLMTTLYVLAKEGEVVKHKTFAYARNQRERRECYKLTNQKGCDFVQETLLLEFTYFGRRTVPMRSVQSDFSAYPESISTTASSNYDSRSRQEMSERVSVNDALSKRNKKLNKRKRVTAQDFCQPTSVSRNNIVSSPPRSNVDIREKEELKTFGYSSLMNDSDPMATFLNTSELQKIEIVPIVLTYSNQTSSTSSESDYRTYGPIPNLNKFRCSEKILYEDGFFDVEHPTCSEFLYTDGFYLSDNVADNLPVYETVSSKLQKRKLEKNEEKEEIKNYLQDWYARKLSSISFVPTEISDPSDVQTQYRFLEFVPTFEEFLLMLDEDQTSDPRFKRQKQISRKIAQRHNIAKDRIQGGLGEAEVKPRKKSNTVSKLQPITGKLRRTSTTTQALRDQTKELKPNKLHVIKSETVFETQMVQEESTDVQRMAKEVGGVTVSKPCEKHVMEHGGKRRDSRRESKRFSTNKTISNSEKKKKPLCTPSIYLSSPTGAHFVLYQAPPSSLSSVHSKDEVKKRSSLMKMQRSNERRTSLNQKFSDNKHDSSNEIKHDTSKEIEDNSSKEIKHDSSKEIKDDTIKEIECQTTSPQSKDKIPLVTPELFDARKLNTRYSFERLRGKNYHKKKPAFYNILRKYYRTQKAVGAFQESNAADRKKQRKSAFHRLLHPDESYDLDKSETIGKLKQYNFLLHRRRTRVKIDPQTFESYSMEDFKNNVLKALDDFVVRKEYVISDTGAKSSTTITFTRKCVFSRR